MVRPTDRRQEMKADRDDAPEHLRRRRGQSFGKWTLAIALGLGLSGLALYMAGNKLSFLQNHNPANPLTLRNLLTPLTITLPKTSPKRHQKNFSGKALMHAIINRANLSKLFITIVITGRKSRLTSTHRQPPSSSVHAPATTATPDQSSKPRTNL